VRVSISYEPQPDGDADPGEVRLNRLLRLAPDAVRREGARVDPQVFTAVIAAAREFHQLPQ
jgi:hypothetical protein